MLKNLLILIMVTLTTAFAMGQEQLTWQDFADVSFEPEYVEEYDSYFLMPDFGEKIKSHRGNRVSITGYFLDLSGSGEIFLVSQNPMASCFFCGAAGPETIIQVHFGEKPPFNTDQVVTVVGTLELNRDDVRYCNYILKNASGKLIN